MYKSQVDALIIGGGIAGLWMLATLKSRGVNAVLCEASELGGVQTIASQGIIHGGTKYALTGQLSEAAVAIASMPDRWRAALRGEGDVDLRGVECLSEHQLLWTSPNLASKMTGFFASKVMQSRMVNVDKSSPDYPEFFRNELFKGSIYKLDEPVINVSSLIKVLHKRYNDVLLKAKAIDVVKTGLDHYQVKLEVDTGVYREVDAQATFVFAGEGNEALIDRLKEHDETLLDLPKMQRRPLHMIYAKGKALPMIYAHGLGVGDKPKVTITSHKGDDDEVVWYIGGEPAEQATHWSSEETIGHCKNLLKSLMPWLDANDLSWSSFMINRAEGWQEKGKRPDYPVIKQVGNLVFAWPTKLALSPMLVDQVLKDIHFDSNKLDFDKRSDVGYSLDVGLASYPWD